MLRGLAPIIQSDNSTPLWKLGMKVKVKIEAECTRTGEALKIPWLLQGADVLAVGFSS